MTARADLPRLDELPIPADVAVDAGWPESMREMADYIGAYDTLRVSEALGGEEIYIAHDPARSPLRDVLDAEKVEVIARVYGGSRYAVPTASRLLRSVRRAGIIAAVRAGTLTGADAARICRTSRTHMAYLVNQTAEGRGAAPAGLARRPRHDPRQIDMFDGGGA